MARVPKHRPNSTPGPRPTGDLLGKGNGETKRAYRGLIEAGVIVPPTYRRATEKGRMLVQNG